MSDEVKAGDVVERVPYRVTSEQLAKGVRSPCAGIPPYRLPCRVEAVTEVLGEIGLVLIGWPSPHPTKAWHAAMFRKLNDGQEDAELIARIRACKPIREEQPA